MEPSDRSWGITPVPDRLRTLSLLDVGLHRRVNGDLVVSSKFTDSFSLATSFLVRYDSRPLPGKQNLDTITSINLVYALL